MIETVRLQELIAAYLEAAGKGQVPPREEWLAAHPDLTDELRRFLDNHEWMVRMGGSPRQARSGGSCPHGRRRDIVAVAAVGHRALLRRLRIAGRNRSRRHGRRLQGPSNQPQPRRRAEDDPGRPACQRERRAALPRRGRGRGEPRSSEHRAHPRGRRSRGPAVFLDEVRRGRQSRRGDAGASTRPATSGYTACHGRSRDPLRPPARHPAPRRQAGQHPLIV